MNSDLPSEKSQDPLFLGSSHQPTSMSILSIDSAICTVRVTDWSSGTVLDEVKVASRPTGMCLSSNQLHLAVGTYEGTAIIDCAAMETIKTLPTRWTLSVAYSHDDVWFATGEYCTLRLFDASNYTQYLMNSEEHINTINSIAFSPSSTKLITASNDTKHSSGMSHL